jgi:hypothetical protein
MSFLNISTEFIKRHLNISTSDNQHDLLAILEFQNNIRNIIQATAVLAHFLMKVYHHMLGCE